MTHPTKAIYKWLIQDSVRVGNTAKNATSQPVYTEQDHLSTYPIIEAIDYHTTHTVSSIRITPYPAGHVLGAAMFLIEISGLNIFFTGDVSVLSTPNPFWTTRDRHSRRRLCFRNGQLLLNQLADWVLQYSREQDRHLVYVLPCQNLSPWIVRTSEHSRHAQRVLLAYSQ